MRLFVALNLAAEVRAQIQAATAELSRAPLPVRWASAASLHLTLKFLGEVGPDALSEIARASAAAVVRVTPFALRLSGTGAFPSLARPRVLWVGAEPAPELLRLHAELERELEPLGFAPEAGPFRPHLTLGRVRRGARGGELRGLSEMLRGVRFEAVVPVGEVDLMQSHLAPEGARYERLRSFPLG